MDAGADGPGGMIMNEALMTQAVLVLSSKNYSSWSLRGWLLLRMSGIGFTERVLANDDKMARAELLSQTSSIRIPYLEHDGLHIWDVLAIAEYVHELVPEAGIIPRDMAARVRCRSISGEMHSGFAALRSALPVNLNAFRPGFPIWSGVRADIDRVCDIWRECLADWRRCARALRPTMWRWTRFARATGILFLACRT
jgi:glutathione S-transferase